MTAPTDATLRRLAEALRAQGGLLAGALDGAAPTPPPGDPGLGALAAAGPRADGRREDLAFVVEAVREGYLLHYGAGRLLRDDDRDLMLLAGDHLYALGLARLAALGDLDAVAELADVISLGAQAHAADDPELAAAVWEASASAVGWGETPDLVGAKNRARVGDTTAVNALRDAADSIRRPSPHG